MDEFEELQNQMMQTSEEVSIRIIEEKKLICTYPTWLSCNICAIEDNQRGI